MRKEQENTKPPKLTDKQEMFCKEYLIDLNATQAAIRAGYSVKTAKDIASQLLAKLNIQERIQQFKDKRAEKIEVKSDDILNQLNILRNSNISDYVELKAEDITTTVDGKEKVTTIQILRFKNFEDLTDDQLSCIESIKEGRNGIELKLHGKEWTIEKINRHIGFYETDNAQKVSTEPNINITIEGKKINLSS